MTVFESWCDDCEENKDGEWEIVKAEGFKEFLEELGYQSTDEMTIEDVRDAKDDGLIELHHVCPACGSDS